MAEVFAEFDAPVFGPDGTPYEAQVCGAEAEEGSAGWEGWIEFVPLDGGPPLRSRRETTQSSRADIAHWATGLSAVYLEGALTRTLEPALPPPPPVTGPESLFEGPAPAAPLPVEPEPPSVLDPFSVYEKGEAVLRSQLASLSAWHLVNIVRAYDLSVLDTSTLETVSHAELVELIVDAVRRG